MTSYFDLKAASTKHLHKMCCEWMSYLGSLGKESTHSQWPLNVIDTAQDAQVWIGTLINEFVSVPHIFFHRVSSSMICSFHVSLPFRQFGCV